MSNRAAAEFVRLVEIMATLRGPDGCPWDREQTIDSLKPGANVTVNGLAARNGSRQVWANTVTSAGKPVYTVKAPTPPPATGRPAPRGPDNHPLLGQTTGSAHEIAEWYRLPSSNTMVPAVASMPLQIGPRALSTERA